MNRDKFIGKIYQNKKNALKASKKHTLTVRREYIISTNYKLNQTYRYYVYVLEG